MKNYNQKLQELTHKEWVNSWKKSVNDLAIAADALQAATTIPTVKALKADAVGMIAALKNLYFEGSKSNYTNKGMIAFINSQIEFWS